MTVITPYTRVRDEQGHYLPGTQQRQAARAAYMNDAVKEARQRARQTGVSTSCIWLSHQACHQGYKNCLCECHDE